MTASDGELTVDSPFTLSITPVNDAPVVAIPLEVQSSPEDAAVSFALPAGAFADVDGDALTLTASLSNGDALPAWLSFDGSTFSGQPPQDFNGDLAVTVTASDGQFEVSDDFTLSITPVNDAPVVAIPLEDQSSPEDAAVSFAIPAGAFADVDGDNLTLAATLAGGGALPSWLNFDGQTFSGQPPQDFNGVVDISVAASDGDLSASSDFSLTITPVNDAPVAADDGPFDAAPGEATTIEAADLLANDVDVDGDDLAIVAVGDAVGGEVALGANDTIVFTADAGTSGPASFTYTVSDGELESTATVTLDVDDGDPVDPYEGFVRGTEGRDFLFGRLFRENKIFADAGNDLVVGGFKDDTLVGGDGRDKLIGLFGDDRLEGGEGKDKLSGGFGSDVFVFGEGDGRDKITDFGFVSWFRHNGAPGDRIELDIDGVDTAEDALSFASQVGRSVVFDFGEGDVLTLRSTRLSHLDEDDFIFG